jgi:hypothetical protein
MADIDITQAEADALKQWKNSPPMIKTAHSQNPAAGSRLR